MSEPDTFMGVAAPEWRELAMAANEAARSAQDELSALKNLPPVGSYVQDKSDSTVYEVIGHNTHSPFNVILRQWAGTVSYGADKVRQDFIDVTDEVHRKMEMPG